MCVWNGLTVCKENITSPKDPATSFGEIFIVQTLSGIHNHWTLSPPPANEVEGRGYIAFTLCAVCSSACLSVPRLLTRLSTHAVGNRCIDCSESLWTHYSISEDVHLEFFYRLDNHSLFYKIFSFFFYFFITRNSVLKIMIFYLNIENVLLLLLLMLLNWNFIFTFMIYNNFQFLKSCASVHL